MKVVLSKEEVQSIISAYYYSNIHRQGTKVLEIKPIMEVEGQYEDRNCYFSGYEIILKSHED